MGSNQFDEVIRLALDIEGTGDVAALQKALEAVGQSGTEAAPKAKALADALEKLSGQNQLIETLVKEKAALAETGDALTLAKLKLADLQKQLSATASPSAALQKSFDKTQASVVSLDAAYNQHTATITKTNNALAAAGISTNNLDSAQRGVQASIAGVASEASNLGKNLSTVAVATEAAGEKAAQTGGLFSTLRDHLVEIVSIAAAVEVALKGIEFGKQSLQGAEQVEASLSRVQALATGAAGKFEELDQAIETAARSVNVSTQTSANGLAALAAQGLTAEQSIKALVPTLQLAKIAQVDVGLAAADVATVIKAYGIDAADTAAVVDKLTSASHGAAGGLGEMAEAAARLAPDAKSIGLSFDDVASVLGLLASRGTASAKSLEGLRTLFQQLQNPTSDLRVNLLALGDGTADFNKAIAALGQNTPTARNALNSLDGSARSLVQSLIQAGPSALSTFNAGLQATQGFASKTAAALDNNLVGAATKFGHALDDLGEKLVKPILAPFTAELVKLADKLNAFADSPDFEDIRKSVSKMATDAATAIDKWITQTDWEGFGQRAKHALDDIQKTLETVTRTASLLTTTIGKAGDTIGTIYHGVGVAVSGAVAVATKGADDLAAAGGKIAGIKQDGSDAAKGLENVHSALQTLNDSAVTNFQEHAQGVVEDLKGVAGIAPGAAEGITETGTAASTAAPAMSAHAQASKNAADASEQLTDSLGLVPKYLDDTKTSVQATVPYVNNLSDAVDHLQGGPIQDAKKALADASRAFADLNATGAATPQQMAAVSAAVLRAAKDLEKLQGDASTAGASMESAFKGLGAVSQKQLQEALKNAQTYFTTIKNGSDQSAAGLADVGNAFLASAQKQLTISALLDQATQDQVKHSLEAQAADLGLSDKLAQLEDQANRTGQALDTMGTHRQAQQTVQDLGNAAQTAGQQTQGLSNEAQEANDALSSFGLEGANSLNQLTQALADTRAQFSAISDAAAKAFDTHLLADFFDAFDSTGIGFSKVIQGMTNAAAEVSAQIANQRNQLKGEIDQINELGTASTSGFGAFGTNADAAAAKMQNLADLIAQGKFNAGLLGQQDLQPLQQALEAAADRARQLADQTAAALAQFNDLVSAGEDALDEAAGNSDAIEERRHEKQLADLQSAAKAANELNSAEYKAAVDRENKLHQLKLKNIQTQQAAQNAGSGSGSNTSSKSSPTGLGGGGSGSGTGGGGIGGGQPITLNVHIEKPTLIGSDVDKAAEAFAVPILKQLKQIQANSRGNIFTGK